ncbi:unnamed protein product [Rhizophagus irregularis]|nr:unnamed protein product [Rhizophagus irregularis]
MLYFDLTGNAAITSNAISREVEERLRLMLALEDPSIIFDLRVNSGFKGTKFDPFWKELNLYFNEEIPAVDDRWHNTIMHMSLAISICDLHNIILAKLHIKHADDKHKVPIGEGMPVSTEVCNHQSLAAQNSTLNVADHDFTKLSLTPSVIFFVSIPKDISDGFYNREVFVSFKDTVFEPSSAIQHTTKFHNVINIKYTYHTSPPILCLYTNRRPNHRCTYGSVQIALISLFLRLQNVAIKQNTMNEESEALFNKVDTLDKICESANKNANLERNYEIASKIFKIYYIAVLKD